MGEFKDRLWSELVREHGDELARTSRRPAGARRRVRSRVVAGTSVGLVALGTVLALVLGATRSSPAFAVSRHPDGTVTLTITRLEGIHGANARLAALGIRVRAVPWVNGCVAAYGAAVRVRDGAPVQFAQGARKVEIDPRKIRRDETLVLAAKAAGAKSVTLAAPKLLHGAPPVCVGTPPTRQLVRPPDGKLTCRTSDGVRVSPPAELRPPASGSGDSGTSRNSGTSGTSRNSGNSGNSGTSRNSGTSGTSGTSGSGGSSGTSGTSGSGGSAPRPGIVCQMALPPHSGNSGDSGDSGNSGDSGSGNS
jgi:hypothetical protein